MLRVSCLSLTILVMCLCFISLAYASGMKVEPGLWEIKSQVTSPGGLHDNVSQECIQESVISPERMMDNNSGCEVTDSNADAKSMQWSIRCENEGVAMTGKGNAQSSGSSITGEMKIKANFNGQEFTMNTMWKGKRIGKCK